MPRPGPARHGVALPLRHRPGPVHVPHGAGVAGALVPSKVEVVFAPGGGRESFDQSYAVQQDFTSEMIRLSAKRVSLLSFVSCTSPTCLISKSHVSYDILLKSRSLCLFDHDLGFSINKHFIITLSACLQTISNGTEIQSYQTLHVQGWGKNGPQVARIFQASWGRSGRQWQEQNWPNVGPTI